MSTPQNKLSSDSPFLDDKACNAGSCARDRIFDAAKKLFYRLGIRGVSVDAIAAEADTTKVTFYRVFDSKEDLVVKVLEDQSQRFWNWWDAVIAKDDGNPRAQLDALFANIRDRIAGDDADRGCPLCNAAVEVVEEEHPAREVIRAHRAELGKRLRDLCHAMGARQPDVLGDALTLLLSGLFSARIDNTAPGQFGSVYDAAKALIESPALGVAAKSKR
jgi:AcrR family transcriptional regulator